MKWENHKDHVGFDWLKEGIYLNDITKLQKNCMTSTMDALENHESILKSKMAVMMAQKNEMMDRMQNPTMRVEEEKPNQREESEVSIDIDMDIEGDCCSQFKRSLIEDDIKLVDFISEAYENWKDFANSMDDPSYYLNSREEYDESFAEWINEWDCDRLVRLYEELGIKTKLIEEYDLCQQSSMGEDFNTKNAMLKRRQERTFIITEVDWDMKIDEDFDDEKDPQDRLWTVGKVTAKELEIEEDYTQEDIEDEISSWITTQTGWLHAGFVYHEIRADGTKIDMEGNVV
jgi:hypothetical protein